MAPASDATHGIVHNEGCDLHYWHVGNGHKLILFVPGGNGHGRQFNNIMAALALKGDFTCATFDRRQMSSSQPVPPNKPRKLSPPQQARDMRAVIQAISGPENRFTKAIIFGSSSGGIFSFQFAQDYPDMVDHLISHEAGISSLLPDANEVFEWFLHLIELYQTQGLEAAAAEFEERLTGYKDEGVVPTVPPEKENRANFWEYEFPSLLGYTPNFWRIKQNGTSIGVMRGVRCRDAFFARAVDEQAKVLECPAMVVAGHHQGFECETEEFLPSFLEMLRVLDGRRNGAI
ncbi:Alpha/Beta hydrolase fold [Naviculisporaceae sp. PSN 640]